MRELCRDILRELWCGVKWFIEPVTIGALVTTILCIPYILGYFNGKDKAREEFEKEMAVAMAQQGAKDYEKLTRVVDAHKATRDYLDSVRAESDRMRKLLARREAELAKLNADGRNARCESLLRDGVELLGSCRERLIECAGKHDALLEVAK